MTEKLFVTAEWDPDERVWYIENTDVPGLRDEIVEEATAELFKEEIELYCQDAGISFATVEINFAS